MLAPTYASAAIERRAFAISGVEGSRIASTAASFSASVASRWLSTDPWRIADRAAAGIDGSAGGLPTGVLAMGCDPGAADATGTDVGCALVRPIARAIAAPPPPMARPSARPKVVNTNARLKRTLMTSRVPHPGHRCVPTASGRLHDGHGKICESTSPIARGVVPCVLGARPSLPRTDSIVIRPL